jgi:hypothetical protein
MESRNNSDLEEPVEVDSSQPRDGFDDKPDELDIDKVCIDIFPCDLDNYEFD